MTGVYESDSIKISVTELARTSVFKYLGSATASGGGLTVEVNARLNVDRSKGCSQR